MQRLCTTCAAALVCAYGSRHVGILHSAASWCHGVVVEVCHLWQQALGVGLRPDQGHALAMSGQVCLVRQQAWVRACSDVVWAGVLAEASASTQKHCLSPLSAGFVAV